MAFLLILLFLITGLYILLIFSMERFILQSSKVPHANTILVLGAGVKPDGTPSKVLEDRLITVIILYRRFSPKTFILSGTKDGTYDEPASMRTYLISRGIPETAINMDDTGFSTFHSITNLNNPIPDSKVVIVTQRFHQYRSLMISRMLGYESVGVYSENYRFCIFEILFWYFREFFAIPYNLIRVWLYKRNKTR